MYTESPRLHFKTSDASFNINGFRAHLATQRKFTEIHICIRDSFIQIN